MAAGSSDGAVEAVHGRRRREEHERAGAWHHLETELGRDGDRFGAGGARAAHSLEQPDAGDASGRGLPDDLDRAGRGDHDDGAVDLAGHVEQARVARVAGDRAAVAVHRDDVDPVRAQLLVHAAAEAVLGVGRTDDRQAAGSQEHGRGVDVDRGGGVTGHGCSSRDGSTSTVRTATDADQGPRSRHTGAMPSVDVDGITIEYERSGAGEPLLLVMGLGAQLSAWPAEMVQGLMDLGYDVIRFDNRDIGLSSRCDWEPPSPIRAFIGRLLRRPVETGYVIDDMADDAAGLLPRSASSGPTWSARRWAG